MIARRRLGVPLLAAALSLTGCAKATFVQPGNVGQDRHEEWTDFYVFGLVGEEHIDARKFCPDRVAQVRTGANAGTLVVTILTIGIYAPRKVYVTCGAAPTFASSEVSR